MDEAINLLTPYINASSIIIADEHWEPSAFKQAQLIITNRKSKTLAANEYFSDYIMPEQSLNASRVLMRIGKEKAANYRQINLAIEILSQGGELYVCGGNKEGIKGIIKALNKEFELIEQSLNRGYRIAGFNITADNTVVFDDRNYQDLIEVTVDDFSFFSKPGVFGWNKIDLGSRHLAKHFKDYLEGDVLDLGCGWGYLSLEACKYDINSITATDNNAAALIACEVNLSQKATCANYVLASDAGSDIKSTFDRIICNPPFHRGFNHDTKMTDKFMEQTHRLLNSTGSALWVVNQFVGVYDLAKLRFKTIKHLERVDGFDIWLLSMPR